MSKTGIGRLVENVLIIKAEIVSVYIRVMIMGMEKHG